MFAAGGSKGREDEGRRHEGLPSGITTTGRKVGGDKAARGEARSGEDGQEQNRGGQV
jgi:hypothetical protein